MIQGGRHRHNQSGIGCFHCCNQQIIKIEVFRLVFLVKKINGVQDAILKRQRGVGTEMELQHRRASIPSQEIMKTYLVYALVLPP